MAVKSGSECELYFAKLIIRMADFCLMCTDSWNLKYKMWVEKLVINITLTGNGRDMILKW